MGRKPNSAKKTVENDEDYEPTSKRDLRPRRAQDTATIKLANVDKALPISNKWQSVPNKVQKLDSVSQSKDEEKEIPEPVYNLQTNMDYCKGWQTAIQMNLQSGADIFGQITAALKQKERQNHDLFPGTIFAEDTSLKNFNLDNLFGESDLSKASFDTCIEGNTKGAYAFKEPLGFCKINLHTKLKEILESTDLNFSFNPQTAIGDFKGKFKKFYSAAKRTAIPYVTTYGGLKNKVEQLPVQATRDTEYVNFFKLNDLIKLVVQYSKFRMPGMATPFYLLGEKGTFSDLHIEEARFASINLCLVGFKLWLIVDRAYNRQLEEAMWHAFPKRHDDHACKTDMRHKGYLATPEFLDNHSIPYHLIPQDAGKIVYTQPGVYHSVLNIEGSLSIAQNVLLDTYIDDLFAFQEYRQCCSQKPSFVNVINSIKKTVEDIIRNSYKDLKKSFGKGNQFDVEHEDDDVLSFNSHATLNDASGGNENESNQRTDLEETEITDIADEDDVILVAEEKQNIETINVTDIGDEDDAVKYVPETNQNPNWETVVVDGRDYIMENGTIRTKGPDLFNPKSKSSRLVCERRSTCLGRPCGVIMCGKCSTPLEVNCTMHKFGFQCGHRSSKKQHVIGHIKAHNRAHRRNSEKRKE